MLASILGVALLMVVGFSGHAVATTTIRFVNGREVVVREYWYAGDRLVFSTTAGSVAVPRASVAAIQPQPRPTIKGAYQAVNVTGIAPAAPPKQ